MLTKFVFASSFLYENVFWFPKTQLKIRFKKKIFPKIGPTIPSPVMGVAHKVNSKKPFFESQTNKVTKLVK